MSITPVIKELFNASMWFGEIPDEWKVARIAPISKEAMLLIQETIDQYHYYPFSVSCLKNMFRTSWLNILKNNVFFPYNNGASLLASLQQGTTGCNQPLV